MHQFFNAQPPFYSPVLARSQLIPTGTSFPVGSLASPQSVEIRNPNKTAMLVDQFRFACSPNNSLRQIRFSQTRVNIHLANIPLTNDFVPILAMCPTYNGHYFSGTTLASQLYELNASYVWHLPRPMYVPPNVPITLQLKQFAFTANGTIPQGAAFTGPLDFAIAGRSLPVDFPVPPEIFVPWATSTIVGDVSLTSFVSADRDLVNPHSQALKITKFIGHSPWLDYNTGTGAIIYNGQLPTPLTVRMSLSSGKLLVRDPVPFYNLFTPTRRFMDIDGVLQANEFVRAAFNAPIGFPSAGANATCGMADLSVGMIGYRVLKTPQGSWT